MEFIIESHSAREVVDITEFVQDKVDGTAKAIHIYAAHTTCAVTTADLDPGTDEDLLEAVWKMLPGLQYRHPHNPLHTPAHIVSSLIGPGLTVPVNHGELILGSWQRIVLIELDGPRQRKVIITKL